MNILIVSATQFEINFLLSELNFETISKDKEYFYSDKENRITILIAGIGGVFTVYNLSKYITNSKLKYDFVINTGIAGSFDKKIKLGEVIEVVEDQFADLAIEQAEGEIKTFFEAKFLNSNEKPFKQGILVPNSKFLKNIISLQKKKGISVNLTHGKTETIQIFKSKYKADIESMEGAAVFFVCMNENIPVIQIRAISNYVESRKPENWKIKEAIMNLNNYLINLIRKL